MAVNLSFIGGAGWQFLDNNGNPLSGGKIYTYAAGTTTPLATYTSRTGLTANSNPIVLDAAGRTPEQIWSTEGLLYKYVVANSNDVVIRTWDNIGGSVVASDLAQDLANTTDNTKGDALIGFKQSNASGFASGAVAKTVNAKFQEMVSVKDFGAVGDGVTDDTAAISAAFAYAATQTNPIVYFPAGTYPVTSSAAYQYTLTEGMEIRGDGMDASIISWTAQNPGSGNIALIGRAFSASKLNSASIRDLAIVGDHKTSGYIANSSFPILIYSVNSLRIHRVKITYSRVMAMAVRDSYSVDVSECYVGYCARDGISTADCNFVRITNNRIEYCDDDAIAGHTYTPDVADRDYVITGNIIRFSQGIKCLGQRSITITGNTLEYCMSQGISVKSDAQTLATQEGVTALHGVTITGNTIKNMIDRSYVDGLTSRAPYIFVTAESAKAGSLAVVPGRNDPATGTITSPYPYYYTVNNVSVTQPVADGMNIVVSGNNLVRDMYPTAKISDYGFGSFYTRTGPVDPAVVEAMYRVEGIIVDYRLLNVNITGNVISGIGYALLLDPYAQLVNSNFAHNIIFDCTFGVVAAGANTNKQNLTIANNIFDLDPFFVSSNRGSAGTWLANGNPTAIATQNSSGYGIVGNTFKNVCRVCDKILTNTGESENGNVAVLGLNYAECQPVATTLGFNTANKGIGNLLAGNALVYKIVDSDPNSATYGQVQNNCSVLASAKPTSGYYVAGHVTWIAAPPLVNGGAGSQYIIAAYKRVTNGTGHVLNTDWIEMRTLTGT